MKINHLLLFSFVSLLVSFFGSIPTSIAQPLMPEIIDTVKNGKEISISGTADVSSSAIDNGMISPFLFGGEISSASIQRNINRQKTMNRGGIIMNGELLYKDFDTPLFKNKKLGFGVQMGYTQFISLSYTKSLFDLVFQGNESYAGQNMNLNSTSFSNIGFQKVGFGLFLKKTQSHFFLNLISISDFSKGSVKHGTIQQSNELDQIGIDMAAQFSRAISSAFSKGAGLSIDIKYNIPLKIFKNKNAKLSVQLSNLGVAYLYQGTNKYTIDTIQHYSGFTVNQLLDGVVSTETSLLDTLGVHQAKGSSWVALPASIQLSKEVNEDFEGKIQSLFGVKVFPISNYRPLVFIGGDYRPIQNLHLGLIASYGGFSTFRGTFYIQYRIKGFGFGISTDNIVGMVSKKGFGQTYSLRLAWKF